MPRQKAAALLATAAAVAAIVAAATLGSSATAAHQRSRRSSLTAPPASANSATRRQARAPTAVVTASLKLSAPGNPPAVLPTEVWYPAPARSARASASLRPPYPLLVFSQGFGLPVSAYSHLLRHWAAAGFVVAAPTYPYTAPPGPLDEADIINHPAELRAVVTALTNGSTKHGSPLAGLVNGAEVGLVGHSDGGDVSLAVAANTCCHDSKVKAVALLSGAELSSFGGAYFVGPQVPLLVVQGSDDLVNVPACSVQLYDQAKAPKFYLDLLGAGHRGPYIDKPSARGVSRHADAAYQAIVAKVATDFFDAELKGAKAALASLVRAGDAPGLARLFVGGQAPGATGSCPGAPA
jgi:predicted dienelactone hydrolase